MGTVSKRELNQHTAAVLARATAAGEVLITERGTPRWRISEFRGDDMPLARLQREGRYTPPAVTPAAWPSVPAGPSYTDDDVDALLGELRGDH